MAPAVHSAESIVASVQARYPNAETGEVSSISAAADSTVASISAGAVTSFASYAGKLQYVRAKIHFLHGGALIQEGQYVQVTEDDAKRLIRYDRAEPASDEEVTAAQKKAK